MVYLKIFKRGDRLYTSESDVCRRQILTYKDGLRTEGLIYQTHLFVLTETSGVLKVMYQWRLQRRGVLLIN